ncbi:uncharacterized protein LOC123321935 [Coccinella septempunctata]|uniref:uncharacterized protein LOC123321935 n=1 Tax=Coccinella septempunctata TaxID=41139 RepID=UPI001D068DA3|nr:uncharacterized protein LOC123321935 [Coccinella septempunctata]
MKLLVVLLSMVVLACGQRPFYASSGPIGRPGLASRFKDDNATFSSTVSVENRVGENTSTPKIPVDARGDVDLVNTLNTWEREHQPFWLLNADHIERARNTTRVAQQTTVRSQLLNSRGNQEGQANIQGGQGGSNVQSTLANRSGPSGNGRNPSVNNRHFGKPSSSDIKPVYEAPERSLGDQRVRVHPGQRQADNSQKNFRFHYERNGFQ